MMRKCESIKKNKYYEECTMFIVLLTHGNCVHKLLNLVGLNGCFERATLNYLSYKLTHFFSFQEVFTKCPLCAVQYARCFKEFRNKLFYQNFQACFPYYKVALNIMEGQGRQCLIPSF